MSKLPSVRPQELIRALERKGFRVVRQSASHVMLRNDAGTMLVASMHAGRDVPPGTLRSTLRRAQITPDELRDLL